MTRVVIVTAALAASMPAAGHAQAYDPSGHWTFTTTAQGEEVQGTLEITASDSGWTAVLAVPSRGIPPLATDQIELDGRRMTVQIQLGDQLAVVVEVVFDDDSYRGTWTFGLEEGEVSGQRRSDGGG